MPSYTTLGPSRIPWTLWFGVLIAAIRGTKRHPEADGRVIRARLSSITVEGDENIPETGTYMIACNHLNGPGIWVGLSAGLLAATIGDRTPGAVIRGVGVAAYQDFRLGPIPVPDRMTEWVFSRFYSVYGIIRMPRLTEGAAVRSTAVRQILGALKAGEVVLIYPEGQNVENFTMRRLQSGVGDLVKLASRAGAPIIPAAVWPDDGQPSKNGVGRATADRYGEFRLTFAPPLQLNPRWDRAEIEDHMGRTIAALLPEQLRGPFA